MIATLLLTCVLAGNPTINANDNKPVQEQKDTTSTDKTKKLIVIIGGKKIIK